MSARLRRAVAAAVATLTAVTLAGCVSLPQSGAIRTRATATGAGGDAPVDYAPLGPDRGMSPTGLVNGFLQAMTATPPSTAIAREFLTDGSSRAWVPENGTVVYGGHQVVVRRPGHAVLRLHDLVELDGRGRWEGDPTGGRGRDYRLRLVKEEGQWRISHPPDRLLVPRANFDGQYQQFQLYFFDRTSQILVPEPVFVPRGRQASTLLVAALLRGPEPDLADVDHTFVPKGTSLDGISVPVSSSGTAEVPLSHQLLDSDDRQLDGLFAQLSWTLDQVPGVRRLRVTVDGAPIDAPGAARTDTSRADWSTLDPSVWDASTTVYALRGGRVVRISAAGQQPTSGALGRLRLGARDLAVDLRAQRIAVVTAAGRVDESDLDGTSDEDQSGAEVRSSVRTVLTRGTHLLRPAYDLYGQLWLVDRTAVGARLLVSRGGTLRSVSAPGVTGEQVTRFALSRDGSRLVTVQHRRAGSSSVDTVRVSRVLRDDDGKVLGLSAARRVPVPEPTGSTGRVLDVAWRTPTTVAVLERTADGSSQVLLAPADGSPQPTLAPTVAPFRGRAVRLVAVGARGARLQLLTSGGRLYRVSDDGWVLARGVSGLSAAVYPG